MSNELEAQVQVVAEARDRLQWAKGTVKDMRDIWERKYADELLELVSIALQVAEEEAALRELTLQAYAETGNKAPAVGVSVKLFDVLNYNPDEAKKWALEHRVALKFDTATFEKIAKVDKPDFVTITEEPRAQIAQSLG